MHSDINKQHSNLVLLNWVHPRIFFSLKGITRDQLDSRRKSGKLKEGYHYKMDPTGNFMFHFEHFDEWVEGKEKTL